MVNAPNRQGWPCRRARWSGALLSVAVCPPLLCLPLLAGCSFNKLVADRMAGSLHDMQTALNREESPQQARAAAPALLSMLDGFIASSPENEELLLAGAEMNAQAAFAFLEDQPDEGAWARSTYRKALRYARRALEETDEDLARTVREAKEKDLRKALAEVEAGDDRIPALFWTGFSWGGLINVTRDDPNVIADLYRVVAIMERLSQIAPGFYHAGPHLFLAVYYGSRGEAIGGDLKLSRDHFNEVFRLTRNRLLLPHVLFAQEYCVQLGGRNPKPARALFLKALDLVDRTPLESYPEQRLQNAIAKAWSKELRPELDDLILPPLPPE